MITQAQKFLATQMIDKGIDKESTITASIHLTSEEEIHSMWSWINSLDHIPSQEEVLSKVVQIIKER